MRDTILIAEDKVSMVELLRQTLEGEGFSVLSARDGEEAVNLIADTALSLILTDIRMPVRDGFEVLAAAREADPATPVIVMTAHGSIETAVEAMKQGAFDFIAKPFEMDHLLLVVRRALDNRRLKVENRALREATAETWGPARILGTSAAIKDVLDKAARVAPAKTTVLLLGESGTGKELFARAIHELSPRAEAPFIAINCAAIPRELLESELFGHERGAFTGADARRPGKFELADRGTIFLDEIGEMDLSLQAKLLRVLQGSEVEHVGGRHPIPIDVRVIAASNRDLAQGVKDRTFRDDLFYRLSVFPIELPPLRQRTQDIPLLVEHFIARFSSDLKTSPKIVSETAMELLTSYPWKGNVRELENAVERALILCDGDVLEPEHFALVPSEPSDEFLREFAQGGTLEEVARRAVRLVETERIRQVLRECGGNKTRVAEALRVSYKTLLTKIKEYNISL